MCKWLESVSAQEGNISTVEGVRLIETVDFEYKIQIKELKLVLQLTYRG